MYDGLSQEKLGLKSSEFSDQIPNSIFVELGLIQSIKWFNP